METPVESFLMILFMGTFLLFALVGYPVVQVYAVWSNRGIWRYVAMTLAVIVGPIYVSCLLRLLDRSGNSKAVALETAALLFCIGFFVTPLLLLIALGGRASRSRKEE